MPRFFVNSMSNFMFQGSIVSFTLQDQAMKTQGGQPRQAEPEDIVDVVMREQDFSQLLQFFNQHQAAYQQQMGKQIGGDTRSGNRAALAGANPSTAKSALPRSQTGGGFKIRPKRN